MAKMQAGLNQIKRFPYSDTLGWSVSRYDKFLSCKRAYYYDYYAKYDPEYSREKIESLKKLTSVPLEIGNIFHDTVKVMLERLLVSEKPIDNVKFLDFVSKITKEYCGAKKFAEVYYGEFPEIKTDLLFENVKAIVNNFLNSPRFQWITKEALTNKKGWIIEPPGYGETRIKEIKAYCKVDFLFPVNEEFYILDWKTGRQDEKKHKKQLLGYATWAVYHFDARPEIVHPMIIYLKPEYSELKIEVSKADIEEFTITVKKGADELKTFCKNIEFNIPKEKSEFCQTENTAVCRFCNYREFCKKQ